MAKFSVGCQFALPWLVWRKRWFRRQTAHIEGLALALQHIHRSGVRLVIPSRSGRSLHVSQSACNCHCG